MSNWINFEIKEKKYYLLCKINDANDCECLLYDGRESWHEKQMLETILARVKAQNRRIQFDEVTIKETLQSGQPADINWIDTDGNETDASTSNNLKLKYSVKSCPFHFTWQFSKQSEHDFQKFILFPLFRIVQGFTQQNQELREIIRKKDIEIKQYKYEFGSLKRATVATQPFNSANFDERFAETLELSKCMMQISDLLKAQYSQMKTPLKAKAVDKSDDDEATKTKLDVKLTPRRKRRKVLEEQQRVIAEKMQALSKPFAYESSQSQVSSASLSDNEAASSSKRLLRSPRKSAELKIENDLDETPTKRNRTQKPVGDQSPAKSLKRNLNAGVEYDDSSDEDTTTIKLPNRNLLEVANGIKTAEKVDKNVANTSPSTRNSARLLGDKSPTKLYKSSADIDVTATAVLTRRNADVFEFSDSADHEAKDSKSPKENTIVTNKTDQTPKLRSNGPVVKIAKLTPVKLAKSISDISAPVAGRLTRKNAGIEYEDSSESAAEEQSYQKSSSSLTATPTKDTNSKVTQSPEQLSDDVKNIIDEWKALEKRRLADLKVKGK